MWFHRKRFDKALQESLSMVLEDEQDVESVLASYPEFADELRPRLETALWLKSQKTDLEPRPGYLAASKNLLMAQLRQSSPTLSVRTARIFHRIWSGGRRYQWLWNSTALLILLLSLALVGFQLSDLAGTSIPGDGLYPVKLILENVRLTLTMDPVEKTHLEVEYSRRRSDEISALIFEGRFELLDPTVKAFQDDVSKARRSLAEIQPSHRIQAARLTASLSEMVESQNVILGLLVQAVPDQARVEIQQAMKVSLK